MRSPKARATCTSCKYASEEDRMGAYYLCLRYPPAAGEVVMGTQQMGRRVVVKAEWWCGEHERDNT